VGARSSSRACKPSNKRWKQGDERNGAGPQRVALKNRPRRSDDVMRPRRLAQLKEMGALLLKFFTCWTVRLTGPTQAAVVPPAVLWFCPMRPQDITTL